MENKSPQNSPEYKPDEPSFGTESVNYTQQQATAKRRRLLIPIILIVVVTLVYQILSWISSRKEAAEKKVSEPVVAAVIKNPPKPQPTLLPNPQVAPTLSPPVDTITQQISLLMQKEQQDRSELARMNDVLNEQKMAMSNLNTGINELTASIGVLEQNVNTLIIKMKPKKMAKKVLARREIYHIKAIVPGRAWLEDSKGRITSVRIGNKINGSRVEWISPLQGVITTSSGEIIQYGANDF